MTFNLVALVVGVFVLGMAWGVYVVAPAGVG